MFNYLNISYFDKIKIAKLFKKEFLKLVTLEKVLNNKQIFNSCFIDKNILSKPIR